MNLKPAILPSVSDSCYHCGGDLSSDSSYRAELGGVSELALQKNSSSGYLPRFLSGLAWGLIPCGLIYSVLPLAFLSGDPLSGLLLMLAFGLGTLPNLLLISGLSARLAGWGHQSWASYLAASLMISTGVIGLYRAFTLPEALLKGGFCFSSTLIYNMALIG